MIFYNAIRKISRIPNKIIYKFFIMYNRVLFSSIGVNFGKRLEFIIVYM